MQIASHKLGVNDLAWSSDSKFIASVSDDKTVKLHDIVIARTVKTMTGHTNYVISCSMNPQSSLIASGGFDETVRIWDVRTGTCLRTMPAHGDPISAVDFNRDGSLLASSSFDGYTRLWDMTTGSCVLSLVSPDQPAIGSCIFTPNGKFLLTSAFNNSLLLWDIIKKKTVKTYTGHKNDKYCMIASCSVTGGQVRSLSYQPPNQLFQYFISGSEDGKIYIWDIQTQNVVQVLEAHTQPVLTTDAHPNLNIIASAGIEPDHKVRIWVSA